MRLSYLDLIKLVEDGVIDADPVRVNGASIDVRLGREIKVERAKPDGDFGVVDLRHAKERGVDFETVDISAGALILPGQFFLAHTVETFNLPNYICADFRLRSSIARCGLNALLANWCLAGDTEIPLLDGSLAKIKDLEGKQVWCYSVNGEGKTVPGFASRVWKTKQTRSTIKITLDDLSAVECTEDHLFMKRDGSWVKACDVIAGMPMASVPRKKLSDVFGSFQRAVEESGYSNHVVLSVERVEYAEPIDVYDMTVDEHHNFVVGTGIVSHNCDPGWHGAQLTLELHNVNQHHALLVTEGLRVGQMIFDLVDAVPEDRSYATVGRYNKQSGATESLGAR